MKSDHQDEDHQKRALKNFETAVNQVRDDFRLEKIELALGADPFWESTTQRLDGFPYRTHPGVDPGLISAESLWDMQARTLLDNYYLQLSQRLSSRSTKIGLVALNKWHSEVFLNLPHAEALCYAAEFQDGLTDTQVQQLAIDIANDLLSPDEDQLIAIEERRVKLPNAYLFPLPNPVQEMWLLLFPASTSHDIGLILHRFLPQLMQNRLKTRTLWSEVKELWPNLEQEQRNLHTQLDEAKLDGVCLEELELLNHSISKSQLRLAKSVGELESRKKTLEIGIENTRRALRRLTPLVPEANRPDWEKECKHAQLALADLAHHLIEKIQTEIQYSQITLHQAHIFLSSLSTTVGVRTAQAERHLGRRERQLTMVLGLFAVVSLPQVFPEWPPGQTDNTASEYIWRGELIGAFTFLILLIFVVIPALRMRRPPYETET